MVIRLKKKKDIDIKDLVNVTKEFDFAIDANVDNIWLDAKSFLGLNELPADKNINLHVYSEDATGLTNLITKLNEKRLIQW